LARIAYTIVIAFVLAYHQEETKPSSEDVRLILARAIFQKWNWLKLVT